MLYFLVITCDVKLTTSIHCRHRCPTYSANVSKIVSPRTIYYPLKLAWNIHQLTGGGMASASRRLLLHWLNESINQSINQFIFIRSLDDPLKYRQCERPILQSPRT